MNLPEEIAQALEPLFEKLPFDEAMQQLVVTAAPGPEWQALVDGIIKSRTFQDKPALAAGLWLYVDDLEQSHILSQGLKTSTGSFWHGIMHRREGDFGNSHYWFNRAGHHPAMDAIPGYDSHAFVDAVATRHRESPLELIEKQRAEWRALFEWCANH